MYGAEQLLGGFWFLRQLFLATLLGWSIIKGVQITARHLPSMNYKYTVLTRGDGRYSIDYQYIITRGKY